MTNEEIPDRDQLAALINEAVQAGRARVDILGRTPDGVESIWDAAQAILESDWLAEVERRAWQYGLDEGRKIGIAQGHQSGLRENISHLRAGIHDEASEGIALAIERQMDVRLYEEPAFYAGMNEAADIAREWLPS